MPLAPRNPTAAASGNRPAMAGAVLGLMLMLVGGCEAAISGNIDADGSPSVDGAPADAGAQPDALVLGAWGTPQAIPGAADATNGEDDLTLNAAATELIYAVNVPGSGTSKDLFVMTRADAASPWSAPLELTGFNTAVAEESPRLSLDDLTIYFGRGGDIFSATRTAVGEAWTTPVPVASVNTAAYEKWLAVCAGGVAMISRYNDDSASQDLYQGTLADGAPTLVAELSSTSNEISTFLSRDCNTTYFGSNRSGEMHLYTATRASAAVAWSAPVLLPSPFADGTTDEDAWVSTDQRTFVFASVRGGATTKDLYISTR